MLNATNDTRNTDPLLDPAGLQDNGGPTPTIALQPASPAINRGNRAALADLALNTDQRGFPRPVGSAVVAGGDGSDIGAFELVPNLVITTVARLGNDLRLTFTGTITGKNYEIQAEPSLVVGPWTSLPGTIAGTNGPAQFTVTNAFTQAHQFYRVHQLP